MSLFTREYPSEAAAERAWRRRWILIPGVAVLLCVVVGLVSALGPWRTQEAVITQSYAAGITKIELADPGDITVISAPVDGVQASWETHWNYRKPAIRGTRDGSTLKLGLDCSYSVGVECSADLRLIVPSDIALDVTSTSGDVSANGISGPVTVHSVNGDVRLSDITGGADVRDTSGDVMLWGIGGKVTANSTSGDVRALRLTAKTARLESTSGTVHGGFSTVPEQVTAISTSGDVDVTVPQGSGPYQVRADSASGEVRTGVNTGPSATPVIGATSRSGDVSVTYGDDDDDGDNNHRHDHGAPEPPQPPRPPDPPRPGQPG